jgi:K+-transporting ATPase A subunit
MEDLIFVGSGILAKPLGAYMARVYEGKSCGLDKIIGLFGCNRNVFII